MTIRTKLIAGLALVLMLFCAAVPVAPSAFAADVSITATNCIPSSAASYAVGTIATGVTVTRCQALCLDASTNTLQLADANGTCKTFYGLADGAGGGGQTIRVITKDPNLAAGFVPTPGAVYVTSQTAGGIAPVTDNLPTATPGATGVYTTVIGVGKTATTITLDPVTAGAPIP